MSLIKKASRNKIPLKIGVRGSSGSGKTYSSILLAKGLMGGSLDEVCILDTENSSANLYAHLGGYSVLPFEPPFTPDRYSKAIAYCVSEGVKCLIIDSISHEWQACLDMVSKIPGNSFTAWRTVTPKHDAFITSILQAPIHIICTMRTKDDYILEANDKGKMTPRKVGMKEVQRDNLIYEFTSVFDINFEHNATMNKDRTDLFNDDIPFKITEEIGKQIKDWNSNQAKPEFQPTTEVTQ